MSTQPISPSERVRLWRIKNQEYFLAQRRNYYERPKERLSKSKWKREKERRANDNEYANHIREIKRESARRNRKTQKAWQEANKERVNQTRRQIYAANSERILARQSEYRKENPHIRRFAEARRRARKKSVAFTLTHEQWQAILKQYRYRCAYCDKKMKNLHAEHVIPISKGGGTTPDNIVPACISCNSRKRDREPDNLPPIRLLL